MNASRSIINFIDDGKENSITFKSLKTYLWILIFMNMLSLFYVFGLSTRLSNIIGIMIGIILLFYFLYLISIRNKKETYKLRFLNNGVLALTYMCTFLFSAMLLLEYQKSTFWVYILCLATLVATFVIYYFLIITKIKNDLYERANIIPKNKIVLASQMGSTIGLFISNVTNGYFTEYVEVSICIGISILISSIFSCGLINFLKVYYINKYKLEEYS